MERHLTEALGFHKELNPERDRALFSTCPVGMQSLLARFELDRYPQALAALSHFQRYLFCYNKVSLFLRTPYHTILGHFLKYLSPFVLIFFN